MDAAVFQSFQQLLISNAGNVVFDGQLSGDQVDQANNTGIWSDRGANGLQLLARAGNPAPDTSSQFLQMNRIAFSDADDVAFIARLTGSGVNGSNDIGLWSDHGGDGFSLVAREGDAAPGTGANFGSLFFFPTFGGTDDLVFFADYVGNQQNQEIFGIGLWRSNRRGELTLVARTGGEAPGTSGSFESMDTLAVSSRGQVAFIGVVDGRYGIWAEGRDGRLRSIALSGELLDVDNGPLVDHRTISFVSLTGVGLIGDNSRVAISFNEVGQLTFVAEFTDGSSGVFVSKLVAVPEPSMAILAILASLTLAQIGFRAVASNLNCGRSNPSGSEGSSSAKRSL